MDSQNKFPMITRLDSRVEIEPSHALFKMISIITSGATEGIL